MDTDQAGTGYDNLPPERVTVNQVVAWNLAWWRRQAGLTQEQLGARLGWTKVTVSSAERSWASERPRGFSADDLVNIADVLGIPVAGLLLPPVDDGQDVRYEYRTGQPGDARSMYDLLACTVSEPPVDDAGNPLAEAYARRYARQFRFYFGEGEMTNLAGYLDELTAEELVTEHVTRLRRQNEALREMLDDNSKLQEALDRRLGEIRGSGS